MNIEVAGQRIMAADHDLVVIDRQELAGDGIAAIVIGGDGHPLADPAAAWVIVWLDLDACRLRALGHRKRVFGVERRARALAELVHAFPPRLQPGIIGKKIRVAHVAADEPQRMIDREIGNRRRRTQEIAAPVRERLFERTQLRAILRAKRRLRGLETVGAETAAREFFPILPQLLGKAVSDAAEGEGDYIEEKR